MLAGMVGSSPPDMMTSPLGRQDLGPAAVPATPEGRSEGSLLNRAPAEVEPQEQRPLDPLHPERPNPHPHSTGNPSPSPGRLASALKKLDGGRVDPWELWSSDGPSRALGGGDVRCLGPEDGRGAGRPAAIARACPRSLVAGERASGGTAPVSVSASGGP